MALRTQYIFFNLTNQLGQGGVTTQLASNHQGINKKPNQVFHFGARSPGHGHTHANVCLFGPF